MIVAGVGAIGVVAAYNMCARGSAMHTNVYGPSECSARRVGFTSEQDSISARVANGATSYSMDNKSTEDSSWDTFNENKHSLSEGFKDHFRNHTSSAATPKSIEASKRQVKAVLSLTPSNANVLGMRILVPGICAESGASKLKPKPKSEMFGMTEAYQMAMSGEVPL